jgi:LmbE family N-acetylglucosaminyl deacetylase
VLGLTVKDQVGSVVRNAVHVDQFGGARVNAHDHIYLSPHLDDVVLSCGGRIWQQVQAGEHVLAVTICAGAPAPSAPLSPFVQELHARWEHPTDAVTIRQEEDLAALALLGAEAVHWPYTDCIYRRTPDGRFPYASGEALFGEIHPAEKALVAELAARLKELSLSQDGRVYAPLGVGHHVDHQIVRQAAEASGQPLIYYEEFPYAEDPQAVQAALEAKIAAIACYRSQISTFWASLTEMAAAVRAFAGRTDRPAERYWVLGA